MSLRFFLAMLVATFPLSAQGGPRASGPLTAIEGDWLGTLDAGGVKLRLAFHIQNSTGTMDSIDQGANGLALSAVKVEGKNVSLELEAPPASYTGTVNAAGSEIDGHWHQGGASLPLKLAKTTAPLPGLDRPQEPKPPFPYHAEDVAYPSRAAGVQLAATLTTPASGGPFPAVLLITGSGPQDRDETLLGHKPFLVLADYLTRRGVAVLRVDDRGTGKSTGNFAAATTADFVEDAAGSLAFLKSRPEIDPGRIGLIGHSEGAIIGPVLAAETGDVAFVVMMAGTGVNGREVLKVQTAAVMRSAGAPETAVVSTVADQEAIFATLIEPLPDAERHARLQALQKTILARLPEARREAMARVVASQVERFTTPWMRYFLAFDPAVSLRKLKIPVLVLNGSLDQQVVASQNLPAIAQALEQAGDPDYAILKLPGLNHLFQTAKTGSPSEYAQIRETISPVALEAIGMWIERHAKPR